VRGGRRPPGDARTATAIFRSEPRTEGAREASSWRAVYGGGRDAFE
jgi:hypothetical protein